MHCHQLPTLAAAGRKVDVKHHAWCVLVHCRNVLHRLEQEQHAQAWSSRKGPFASGVCASLEVPKPDVGPKCKAMIGICQALTVWMAACTGTMQRVAELGKQGSSNGIHAQQLSVEVKAQLSNQTNQQICFACQYALTRLRQLQARAMLADATVHSMCCSWQHVLHERGYYILPRFVVSYF